MCSPWRPIKALTLCVGRSHVIVKSIANDSAGNSDAVAAMACNTSSVGSVCTARLPADSQPWFHCSWPRRGLRSRSRPCQLESYPEASPLNDRIAAHSGNQSEWASCWMQSLILAMADRNPSAGATTFTDWCPWTGLLSMNTLALFSSRMAFTLLPPLPIRPPAIFIEMMPRNMYSPVSFPVNSGSPFQFPCSSSPSSIILFMISWSPATTPLGSSL
mmetsp:Transcript_52870/g.141262  ORF Transcript_52870/g.141262 Transcript_52870/m.141262 type:complete len:217 (-) Transcript_52870:286-936(-)